MTEVVLVQPPPRVDLVEIVQDPSGKLRGRITRPWSDYLNASFARQGGAVAPSNDDIQALIDSAQLGIFRSREQLAPRPPDIAYADTFGRRPQFMQDPPSIGYIHSFLPQRQEQSTPYADASAIICAKVFAR